MRAFISLKNSENKEIWRKAEKLQLTKYPSWSLREIYFFIRNDKTV